MARASTFTSYINAELPSNIEANWQRYENIASRTYGNIAKRAQEASRAAAGLVGGRGLAGTGGAPTRALQQQAQASRAVAEINGKVATSAVRTAAATAAQGRAAEVAAGQNGRLARNLNALSTSLNVVQGPLGPIAGRVSALGRAINELSGFRLGLAGVAGGLFVIGNLGNQYAQLSGRLRGVYEDQEDVNRAMNEIVGIAQRSRTALEPVADLYIRLAQTAEQYGVSARQAAQISETASKAAILSGGSRQSQQAGLYQFGQAFGSGRLGGEELRSILENTNQLADAIARGMGKSIGELRGLAAEGRLTTQAVAQALDKAALDIEQRYARMPKTLGQATTEFTNTLTVMIGRVDEAIGFTSTLSAIISATAGSLRFLSSAALGVGVAFAAIKLGSFVGDLTNGARQAVVMHAAITQLGARRTVLAEQSLAQHQREVAALEAEQAQIRETIALLERQRAVAAGDFARAVPNQAVGYAGSSRRMAQAVEEEKAAVRGLIQQRQALATTGGALVAANGRVLESTTKVAAATANTAARSGFLRSAVSGVLGVLNPYALAIGAATTALIYLATAQSNAERTAETLTEAQRQLALIVDETTGRIHAQIGALELLARQRVQHEALGNVLDQMDTQRGRLVNRLQFFTGQRQMAGSGEFYGEVPGGGARTPAQQQLQGLLAEFGNNRIGLNRLQREIARLAPSIPGLANELTSLGEDIGQLRSSAEAAVRQGAAVRVASGQARPGDLALALGTINPYQARNARTRAQVDREAAARASSGSTNDLTAARGRRDTSLRELEGRFASMDQTEYLNQREQILRTYDQEIEGIRAARRASSSSAAAGRREAAEQRADAQQEAGNRRDAALLALEERRPTLGQQEYLTAQVAILKTYDDEVNALNELSTASSAAAAQLIRNARQVQAQAARQGERRRDVLGQWSDQPAAVTRAADQIDDLNRMVGTLVDGIATVSEANPLGTGLYTEQMAARDARNIEAGVRRPMRMAAEEFEEFQQVSALRLQGLDAEAAALERAIEIQREQGELSREDFSTLVDIERQQQQINDVLSSRERITAVTLGAVQQARDAFEQLLVDLPERGLSAGRDFINGMLRNARQIWARRITEQLFAGADARVRGLISGQNGIEQAYGYLQQHTVNTGTALERVATAADNAAAGLNNVAGATGQGAPGSGGSGGPWQDVDLGPGAPTADAPVDEIRAWVESLRAEAANRPPAAGPQATAPLGNQIGDAIAESLGDNSNVIVTGQRIPGQAGVQMPGDPLSGMPTGRRVYNTMFEGFGNALDSVFGGTFFKGMSKSMGTAMEGAGQGMIASGIASAFGLKQSSTGAAVGGALGNLIPGLPPGVGSMIGGLIGGTLGGLLKKSKTGSSTISMDAFGNLVAGEATGNNKGMKAAASGAASSVARGLNQIADALGATIGNVGGVSIGQRDGKWRVDPSGTGQTKTKKGAIDFGEDQEAAIAKAIELLIGRGVLSGISAASQKILQSGQDLQTAIEKAALIESIPRRLLQRTNPARYAVEELNREFEKMIAALKEGGGTVEQFSQAQQLYELERAEAIEQATAQAAGAIDQFLKDMIGSNASPLNKRATYSNAQTELSKFATDVNAGKVVDQTELLSAARNFQDASRALNGSSQTFFTDFQMIYDLLSKARDNAGVGADGTVVGLPPSPFESDTAVATLLGNQVDATNNQTNILSGQLDTLITLLGGNGGLGVPANDLGAIVALPGMGGGGSPRGGGQMSHV